MKKLLLGLGSIASVVAPLAAVISCGDDDKNTNAGTQAKTYTITGQHLVDIKTGLHAALAIPKNDVETVVTGDNFTSGHFHVDHYTKITFNKNTSMDYGQSTTINAGDVLVMGTDDARRRTAASAAPAIKMYIVRGEGLGAELTVDPAKQALLKTGVVDKVIEYVQSQQPAATPGAINFMPGQVMPDASDTTKIRVSGTLQGAGLTSLPTHLTEREIKPLMTDIQALPNVNSVTTIEYTLMGFNSSDQSEAGTLPGKLFIITVPAGKAGNLVDVVSAAAGVTAEVPGSGTGGSGSTGGTGTTAVDLDAEAAKFANPLASTKTKTQIKDGLGSMMSSTPFYDAAEVESKLGITLPTLSAGVDIDYQLEETFALSSRAVKIHGFMQDRAGNNKEVHFEVAPKSAITQDQLNAFAMPATLTAQTTKLSETTLKAKISANEMSLTDLGLVGLDAFPNGTTAVDFEYSLAVDATVGAGKDGWDSSGTLTLDATITYVPGSLTRVVKVVVTPTAPTDLQGLTQGDFATQVADVKSPATDAEVDATVGSTVAPAHYNNMTAQDLETLFNKPNKHDLTFPDTISGYKMTYSMTPPTHGSAKGPFTITALATPTDGTEVVRAMKTFEVTTTMAVGVAKDDLAEDGTTATQLNVGSTGHAISIDRPAPATAANVTAEFIDPIVAAIADGLATGTSALQGSIAAATTLMITFNDGNAEHTLQTGTFAPGEATDAAKVLAAAQAGTLT